MKKRKGLLFTILMILMLRILSACSSSTWQEKYDLGVRCLSEGNYEEAILAFEAAIEIDPKKPEAYLGLAYAYIGQNDFDAARDILEKGYELTQDEALKAKLDELDSGNITDYAGNVRKTSFYDGAGALLGYWVYTYDDRNGQSAVTSYNAAGEQTGYVETTLDAEGRVLTSLGAADSDGTITHRAECEYDSAGNVSRVSFYSLATGELDFYYLLQYDGQGRCVRKDDYSGEGELYGYSLHSYGENSDRKDNYAADGTLTDYNICNYREDGQTVDYCSYGTDGTLWGRTVYRYDDDGNCIGSDSYDGEGNLIGSSVSN